MTTATLENSDRDRPEKNEGPATSPASSSRASSASKARAASAASKASAAEPHSGSGMGLASSVSLQSHIGSIISREVIEAGVSQALVFDPDYPKGELVRDVFVGMLEAVLRSPESKIGLSQLLVWSDAPSSAHHPLSE